MHKHTKKERIKMIKEILGSIEIKSQSELLELLKKKGLSVTQATIARDFEEIGIIKVKRGGRVFYQLPEKEDEGLEKRLKVSFENFVIGIKHSDNLILLKTTPGNAGGTASIIDKLELNGIIGTIAGDDTILIIADKKKTNKVLNFFKKLIEETHK